MVGEKMELEREIEKRLVEGVKRLGGRAYKFVSPGNAGVPDRIVMLPGGVILFVELKTEDGNLTANQRVQIRRIRELGQNASIVWGKRGVDDLLGVLAVMKGGDAI